MRFLKHSLLLAALSLILISCGDEVVNNHITEPEPGIGININDSDYYLKAAHRSLSDSNFVSLPHYPNYRDYYLGLNITFKLTDPSQRGIINRMVMRNTDNSYPLAFDFDKDKLKALYVDSAGGYVIDVDILCLYFFPDYGQDESSYHLQDFTWEATLYDSLNRASEPFITTTKTGSYITGIVFNYQQSASGYLDILFWKQIDNNLVSYQDVKIGLYDMNKEKIKDYNFIDVDPLAQVVNLENVPDGVSYFTVEINDVFSGVKRMLRSGFQEIKK